MGIKHLQEEICKQREMKLISKLEEFKFNVDMWFGELREEYAPISIMKYDEYIEKEEFKWFWEGNVLYIADSEGIEKIEINEEMDIEYGDEYIIVGSVILALV